MRIYDKSFDQPEPTVVCRCSQCGIEIYEGNMYYDILGKPWCHWCIDGVVQFAEVSE